ncbi:PEP-CTERM sorting domain-containing protein [Sphingomonas montanisoli]|uniref:PEP-CTERM sorting domain-containing protein n=2 Tax=Sphingomonas montanisoli TaxID=2606412 RepID=A0A5D9CDE0_9SPHN|nr:PEP-CTERM sorting domain-containing protein [Sphingomonas montanisoli]
MRFVVGLLVAVCAMAPASAGIVINSNAAGQSFAMAYTGLVGGVTTNNVTAQGNFTFTSVSNAGKTFNFTYNMLNNSNYDSRLSSFGFNAAPNISSVSSTGYFGYSNTNANYPQGIGNIEICFTAVSNGTCTGNGAGLTSNPDQSGSGTFALTFANAMSSIELSDFAVRFQSINPKINGSSSGVGTGSLIGLDGGVVGAAPDPATWMLMLTGFGLVGMAMRRRGSAFSPQPGVFLAR